MDIEISQFGAAVLFFAAGCVFVIGGYITSRLLAPHRPNPEKGTSYECGEDPVGTARIQLNNRFYVVALIFLIFEVEILFLFPWATVYADVHFIEAIPNWGWVSLIEALVFTLVLLAGLGYVWARGDLDWVRPRPEAPKAPASLPGELYAAFNERMDRAGKEAHGPS